MSRNSAFSVIELLTAISIIAIIAATAIPNYYANRQDIRLRNAIKASKGDLALAKIEAVRNNAIVAVLFSESGYRIFLDNGSDSGNWIQENDELLLKSKQLPSGIKVDVSTTLDAPNNRIRFSGRGFPDPATLKGAGLTGTLTFSNAAGRKKSLSINRLGEMTEF